MMKEKLAKLIPEFQLIQDESLRDKVFTVWEDALNQGGWKVEDLTEIPFTLLIEHCKVNFVEHIRAVTRVSYQSGKIIKESYQGKIEINIDYLVAGALLHDIGKLLEYKREGSKFIKSTMGNFLRHPFSGVGLAFARELPLEVLHIIAVHAKEGDLGKRIPEAVILHHADFMNFETLK